MLNGMVAKKVSGKTMHVLEAVEAIANGTATVSDLGDTTL